MIESQLTRQLIHHFNSYPKVCMIKIVQSAMANAGIPDLLGHISGKFIAIECKILHEPKCAETKINILQILTPRQQYFMRLISNSGALAYIGLYLAHQQTWCFIEFSVAAKTMDLSEILRVSLSIDELIRLKRQL